MRFENQTLDARGGDISVDGNAFVGCLIKNARLVYSGGSFEFDGTRCENVSYILLGPAASTNSFLTMVCGLSFPQPDAGAGVAPAAKKGRNARRRKSAKH